MEDLKSLHNPVTPGISLEGTGSIAGIPGLISISTSIFPSR